MEWQTVTMKTRIDKELLTACNIKQIRRYAVVCSLLWALLLSALCIVELRDNLSADAVGGAMSGQMLYVTCFFIGLFGVLGIFIGYRKIVRLVKLLEEEHQKLYESELKCRTISDYTHSWEYWLAVDGSLVYISPSCESLTGYTAEEFMRDPDLLTRIVHLDELEIYMHHHDLVKDTSKAYCETPDFRIITRSGEECWIVHICQEVFDGKGNSIGRRVSNSNVTKRKQAEQLLPPVVSMLNATLDATVDGILVVSESGYITKWNQKFADIWEISEETLNLHDKHSVVYQMALQVDPSENFSDKAVSLYKSPENSSATTLHLTDGRILKMHSRRLSEIKR